MNEHRKQVGAEENEDGERKGAAADPEISEDQPRLEESRGPRAPRGDALQDGSGNRHGVDHRDQRPGERG